MWGRRCRALLIALIGVVAVGCTAIPVRSQPEAVPQERSGQSTQEVPEPARGLDPLSVVREFIRASAQPGDDHAASRVYLAEHLRDEWQPGQSLAVIQDEFGTVYAPEKAPSPDDGDKPSPDEENESSQDGEHKPLSDDERLVTVQGMQIGRLGSDQAFIPSGERVQEPVRVQMQSNGQWRIVGPPDIVMITESDFSKAYAQVPVYFFAPDSPALVPDLRYVVARPRSDLPARVMDLLLSGPSDGLSGAVRTMLDDEVTLDSNVRSTNDGALVVPLTGIGEQSVQDKKLLAAQVVRSLHLVTTARIRLLADGVALLPDQSEWRPTDLPAYETLTSPSSELPGLMVVDGQLRSLGSGAPVPGAPGSGAHPVESAAQSISGHQLAVVEQDDDGVRLRAGEYGTAGEIVDLPAETMTRPSWRPPTETDGRSSEVWTVVDGAHVVRVKRAPDDRWTSQRVNASELTEFGSISGLRLSRDGTRVAAIVDGRLLVASVVRERDASSVVLRSPKVLQGSKLDKVVDVDWSSQDTLIVARDSSTAPVVRVSVDGLRLDQFNSSNLTSPVRAITAAPGRPIVAADVSGLWTASDVGAVWRPHPHTMLNAQPFYPG